MLLQLEKIHDRYRELEQSMTSPDVVGNPAKYTAVIKEYKSLTPLMEKYDEYLAAKNAGEEAELLLSDPSLEPELRSLANDEFYESKERCEKLTDELRVMLIPKDKNDDRNVIVEIRACAGGEEAALFASDLFRMYSMHAASTGFAIHVISENETDLGGFREITFDVKGEGAFAKFKFESGVHRVQRIPVTESNGKIQTSTVSVAVLPEAEDVEVSVNPSDIKFETCKSSGAGGQHINKTESAVRLTHIPTGIVIECDQERSQFQNKDTALRLLKTKLYDIKEREQNERIAGERRSQIGSGDRSEKIRTYNYPQSRVTDHRINMTVYTLDSFMNGDIGSMLDELTAREQAEKLKAKDEN